MGKALKSITDTVIELEESFPHKVRREAETWALMEEISDALGVRWGAVKLGGYWIIGRSDPDWSPVFGGHEQPYSRVFEKALTTALNRAIVQDIPL
jgi:hypothetical protein